MARDPSITTAFGEVLRELRRKSGVSQEDFAHLCGVHRTYVSMLERGVKQPSLSVLFAVAEALGVRPSRLVRLVEEEVG